MSVTTERKKESTWTVGDKKSVFTQQSEMMHWLLKLHTEIKTKIEVTGMRSYGAQVEFTGNIGYNLLAALQQKGFKVVHIDYKHERLVVTTDFIQEVTA